MHLTLHLLRLDVTIDDRGADGFSGGTGSVYAIPHLGGLHHEYRRAG